MPNEDYRSSFVLDRRVTLIEVRDSQTRDSWNQPVEEEHEHEAWAMRRDMSASERISSDLGHALVSTLRAAFIIRYRPDVDAKWRLRDDGQEFRIEGVRQAGRRRWLELLTASASGG